MKEAPRQYTKRILGYLDGRDAMKVLAATPQRLAAMTRGLTPTQLRWRPAPGKWSITEILAHLSDTELVAAYRYRMIICQSGTPIQAYDQDRWAAGCHYAKKEVKESLEEFAVVRAKNLRLLRSISRQAWERYGLHAERGKETVRRLTEMMAGHDLNHLGQMERLRDALRGR